MMIKAKNTLLNVSGSFVWRARSRVSLRIRTLALCRIREKPILNSTCMLSPMENGLGNFLSTVARKIVSTYSRTLGWVTIQVLSRTLVTFVVAGVLNEFRQTEVLASNFRCLVATGTIERNLLSFGNTYTSTLRRKSGRLFIVRRSICADIPESRSVWKNVRVHSDCTPASFSQRRYS